MADGIELSDAVQANGQSAFVADGSQSGDIDFPENLSVAEADFAADGGDLVLTFPDGTAVTVEGYFDNPNPPKLVSADGAEVGSDVVGALTGGGTGDAPAGEGGFGFVQPEQAEVIQAAEQSGNIAENPQVIAGTDGEPIGNVESLEGEVWAIRVDGSRVRLELGDQVFQGDILESGPEGNIGVLLADETTFAMGPEGRMVLDEMIYDPGTQEGSVSMSVLQGVFTFVSGQVAKTDPDAMTLDTPVATIGIRGTQVGLDIRDGETLNVHLMEELFGFVGEVVVVNDGGVQVLNDANAFTTVSSFDSAPTDFYIVSIEDILESYGDATLPYLPTRDSTGERTSANTFGLNEEDSDGPASDAEFLNDFQTDAGGEQLPEAPAETINVTGEYEALQTIAPVESATTAVQSAPQQQEQVSAEERETTVVDTEPEQDPIPSDLQGFISSGVLNNVTVSSDGNTVTAEVTGDFDAGDLDYTFVLTGDDGINRITTGDGDDILAGTGADDILDAGGGDDTLIAAPGGGDDTYIGGDGIDTISFEASDEDLIINLIAEEPNPEYPGSGDAVQATATADGIGTDTIVEIENVIGGSGDDIIVGDAGDNVIQGGAGDDFIDGGDGQDTAVFSGERSQSLISEVEGVITVTGPDGTDTVENIENFVFTESSGLVVGLEDTAISVDIAAQLPNAAGAASIRVTGVPEGATLSAGTQLSDGSWIVGSGQIEGLTVTGAANSSDDFTLSFDAYNTDFLSAAEQAASAYLQTQTDENGEPLQTLEDYIAENGDVLGLVNGPAATFMPAPSGAGTLDVEVIGLIDPFTVTVNDQVLTSGGTSPATIDLVGDEDAEIPIDIQLDTGDTGGNEVLSVTISGLPTGEVDADGNPILGADGTPQGAHLIYTGSDADGNAIDIVIPPNDTGSYTLSAEQLNNLRLVGSEDDKSGFEIDYSARLQDGDSVAVVYGTGTVTLNAVADAPTVNFNAESGIEDQALRIDFDIDKNDASEHISMIAVTGIPEGGRLAIEYTDDSGETFTLQLPVDANGTAEIPLGFLNDDMQTDGLLFTPPPNFSGSIPDMRLEVTSGEPEIDPDTGLVVRDANGDVIYQDTATTAEPLGIDVAPVADALGVTVDGIERVAGETITLEATEDQPLTFDLGAVSPDIDGSEAVSINIGNIPDGATVFIPVLDANGAPQVDGDGATVYTEATNLGGEVNMSLAEFQAGFRIQPPENSDATMNLSLTVTNTDTAGDETDVWTFEAPLQVNVEAVADAPTLDAAAAGGAEDTAIDLSIASGLVDTDGSESLSITLSGLPEGATLSAGTDNGDGTWTLAPDDLEGLSLTPGEDVSGDFTVTVTATATEGANADQASVTQQFGLAIEAVADAPTVSVAPAVGNEDSAIALDISASLNDTDGSEVMSIVIGGVPAGALLSAGTKNSDGTWSLGPDDLDGLTLIPTPNSDEDFTLTVEVTATEGENNDTETTTQTLDVSVLGVADDPNLDVGVVSGAQDTEIPLDIGLTLTDVDGSEDISISISGLPDGAFLNVGTRAEDGSWTLTPDQLDGLTFLPPADLHGEFTLDVAVTVTETAEDVAGLPQAEMVVAGQLTVDVDERADVPTLMLFDAAGNEDNPVPINIAAVLGDTSDTTTETLSVTVEGLPEGSVLSQGTLNDDGSWTLTPDQLLGLSLTTPEHFSGSFELTVTATSTTEDGTFAENTGSMSVSIAGVADAVDLGTEDATVADSNVVPLDISLSMPDTDGSETLAISISNIPDGATLANGAGDAIAVVDGVASLSMGDLDGLTLVAPPDLEGDSFSLLVTATTTEADADQTGNDQGVASVSGLINVSLTDVAETPTLLLHDAAGFEDDAIPLSVVATPEGDDEVVGITITGVPEGATLSAGVNSGNGVWTVSAEDLEGLTLTPPENANFNFQLGVTVTVRDGEELAETTQALNVSVTAVADKPVLDVPSQIAVDGTEATPLDIDAALADLDGSESLSISISNIPDGATVSLGDTPLSVIGGVIDGISPADVGNLTISAPENFSGNFTLQVTATATDTDPDNVIPDGLETSVSIGFIDIEVEGQVIDPPDAPTLNLDDTVGYEDSAIPLEIDAALTDPSETLSLTISGVPAGASLSAGTDLGNGVWSLLPEEVDGLSITPPADSNIDFDLTVTATSTTEDGAIATTTGTVGVDVIGVADDPNLTASVGEGTPVGEGIRDIDAFESGISNVVMYLDDGSGNVEKVRVESFPDGGNGINDVNDIDLLGFVAENYPGMELVAITVKAGNNASDLTGPGEGPAFLLDPGVSLNSLPLLESVDETLNFQGSFSEHMGGGSGAQATEFPLDIASSLNDVDGSETLSINISGLPDGVSLSAGTENPDGTWSLSPAELDGLTMTVPLDVDPDFDFDVTATATENDGDTASVTASVGIDGDDVADAPELDVTAAAGDEDTAIALDINAVLTDTDGSETLSVTVGDVPAGAVLSAGTDNGDGSWTLTPDQLAGLTITPPADSDADFSLAVSATSREISSGDTNTVTAALPVTVTAVADAPGVSAGDSDGDVAQTVPLAIDGILADTDGSESLSITVAGMPDGASLNAGTDNGDGTYTLNVADLDGLAISLPADASDDFDLTVTATSTEASNQDQASNTVQAVVNVDPLAGDDRNVVEIGEVTTGNVLTGAGDSVDEAAAADTGSATGNAVVDVSFGGVTKSFANPDDVQSDGDGDYIEIAGDHGTLKMYADGSYDYAADESEAVSNVAGLTGTASASAVEEAWSGVQTYAFDFGTSFVDGDGRFDPALADGTVTYTGDGIGVAGTQGGMPVPDQINHDDATGESQALAIDLGGETSSATLTVSRLFQNEDGGEQGAWQAYDAAGNLVGEGVLDASTVDYGGSSNTGTATITLPDGGDFQYLVFTANDTLTDNDDNDSSDFFVRALQYDTDASAGGEDVFTYTMQDVDGDTAQATLSIDVNEEQDTTASDPTLTTSDAAGFEDGAIALDIAAGLGDLDGSETLSITIGGVPAGAVLSAGTDNGDGSWTVAPEDLGGLTITPPADSNDDFTLQVTATSTETDGGDTATTTAEIAVAVTGVADAPSLTATLGQPTENPGTSDITITNMGQVSAGYENSYGYYVKDADGNPTEGVLIWPNAKEDVGDTFTIEGVDADSIGYFLIPNGDTANDGLTAEMAVSFRQDESGEWHVVGPDGSDLVGTGDPVLFSDTSLNEAGFDYTTDNQVAGNQNWEDLDGGGDQDFNDANFDVQVTATPGSGTVSYPLAIDAALADTDGSETLSVTVSNLPDGASLSAGTDNGNGSWTLSPAQLAGLTLTVAAGTDDFDLAIAATTTEDDGDTATVATSLGVDVPEGDTTAEAPDLTASDAAGLEDTAIPLDIGAALTDTDGSETLSITIGGVPSGAVLSAGTDNGDGSWTVAPEDLGGLTITPPADSNDDFTLQVTATSTETDGGDTATTTAEIAVAVTGVADAPSLTATLGEPTVTEVGGETVDVNIDSSNVTQSGAGFTVTARAINPDGTLTEPSADLIGFNNSPPGFGVSGAASGDGDELGFDAGDGVSEQLIVTLDNPTTSADVAFAWMHSGEQGVYELYRDGVKVGEGTVTGITDAVDPAITLTATDGGSFDQIVFSAPGQGDDYLINSISFETVVGADTEIEYPLDIATALADTDGSETLSVTVSNLPDGARLSAGTDNGDGSWTLSPGQLAGLTLTVAGGVAAFDLAVAATTAEDDGDTATVSTSLTVDVPGDTGADGVTLTAADASGVEDTPIPLDIAASLNDLDGSETLSITVAGLPEGATLSAGTDNGNGTWTLSADDLDGLSVTPPADSNVDMTLSVSATGTETDGGATASQTANFNVNVTGVADAPTVSVSATVLEGAGENGYATAAQGLGPVAYYDMSGANMANDLIGGNDGTLNGAALDASAGGLGGVAASFDGNNDYIEIAHDDSLAADEGTFVLWFNTEDCEDKQALFSKDSSGYDDGGHVTAWVNDGQVEIRLQSGSSSYMVKGGDVSSGAWHQMAFSYGPDGMKLYLDGELVDSDGYTGGIGNNTEPLVLGASAASSGDGVADNLKDHFQGQMDEFAVYDRPLTPNELVNLYGAGSDQMTAGDGGEVLVYDLDIEGSLVDVDGSESLSFEVRGLPDGVTLSAGDNDGNGTWALSAGDLEDLTLNVQPGVSEDFAIEVVAISTENDGDTAESVAASLEIEVAVEEPMEINGTWRNETLEGAGGDDTIFGDSGHDKLYGFEGDDVLDGGSGNDSLFGDAGDDVMLGGHNNDELFGGDGNDEMDGGSGRDELYGGAGDDDMFGGWDNDTLDGGEGADTLEGSGGDDTLIGGAGDDTLDGGYDNDILEGGAGDDVLTGGWGSDTFKVDSESGHDIIQDIMEQDTIVFEGQEFHADDMIFNENDDGDVVVSFAGVEGQSVTLNGVSMDDLDRNNDGDPSDGYSVTETNDGVQLTVDSQ